MKRIVNVGGHYRDSLEAEKWDDTIIEDGLGVV